MTDKNINKEEDNKQDSGDTQKQQPTTNSGQLEQVAHTTTGRALRPLDGLKTFLVHNKDGIAHDTDHTVQEGLSDILAILGAAEGVAGAASQQSLTPIGDNWADIGSTACAMYLLYSLWFVQRQAKVNAQKEGLSIYFQYKQDLDDHSIHEERSERRRMARENLAERMRHHGIRYENLPDKAERFYEDEFEADALAYGIAVYGRTLSPSEKLLQRIENVQTFLKQPVKIKAFSALCLTGNILGYAFNLIGDAFKNTGDILKRPAPLINVFGQYSTARTYDSQREKRAKNLLSKIESNSPLTLDDLKGVNLDNVQHIGEGLSDEEISEIRDGLLSIKETKMRAKFALVSFGVQSAFQAFQLVEAALKLAHGDKAGVARHTYTLMMAAGPWRGFAEEYLDARRKINSDRGTLIQGIAEKFGVDTHDDTPAAPDNIVPSTTMDAVPA